MKLFDTHYKRSTEVAIAMLQVRRLEKISEQRSVLHIEELNVAAGDILAASREVSSHGDRGSGYSDCDRSPAHCYAGSGSANTDAKAGQDAKTEANRDDGPRGSGSRSRADRGSTSGEAAGYWIRRHRRARP